MPPATAGRFSARFGAKQRGRPFVPAPPAWRSKQVPGVPFSPNRQPTENGQAADAQEPRPAGKPEDHTAASNRPVIMRLNF
jgi:hypothetical protein